MKLVTLMTCGLAAAILSTEVVAETQSFEGVAALAAGSINPPNPVEGCNKAKQDAKEKAAKADYKSLVKWERLSNDSDCKLRTEGARGAGYIFIFAAKGTFAK